MAMYRYTDQLSNKIYDRVTHSIFLLHDIRHMFVTMTRGMRVNDPLNYPAKYLMPESSQNSCKYILTLYI